MKLATILVIFTLLTGTLADTTSMVSLTSEDVTDINNLTEREFQYLLHKEQMVQDSIIATQTKELAVSQKPEGLYKATAIISIILSTLTASLLTISFISGVNNN